MHFGSYLFLFALAVGQVHQTIGAAKKPKKAESEERDTIEDVDEDKIDEFIEDDDGFLVVFFYDKSNRCPACSRALDVMEQIDDDLEMDGLIEVVKTDDKNVAEELGVHTFPAMVYFRRDQPILYDGEFESSESVLRWLRAHDEVACSELDDDDFEERTDVYDPEEHDLDWYIMFYDETDEECASYEALWESVAHKLRGLVNVGKVDINENDDVADRFNIDDDDDDCPTVILFRDGKMYRYRDDAADLKSFVAFALHRFKEQRGQKIPEPPTLLEELLEEWKEDIVDVVEEHPLVLAPLLLIALVTLIFGTYRYGPQLYAAIKQKSA